MLTSSLEIGEEKKGEKNKKGILFFASIFLCFVYRVLKVLNELMLMIRNKLVLILFGLCMGKNTESVGFLGEGIIGSVGSLNLV